MFFSRATKQKKFLNEKVERQIPEAAAKIVFELKAKPNYFTTL